MICLGMLSTRLFLSHDLDNRFGGLTLFDSSYFFVFFFNQFFLILSFNIRLTDNWASYFISICFLMGYFGLITQVVGLTSKPELTRVIFLSHFLNWFFFSFTLQHWVYWNLSLVICVDLLLMKLSWSHDLVCGLTCYNLSWPESI
jgi:hypothetical protein